MPHVMGNRYASAQTAVSSFYGECWSVCMFAISLSSHMQIWGPNIKAAHCLFPCSVKPYLIEYWLNTIINVTMRSLCEIGGDCFGPSRGTKTIINGFTQWPKVIIFINNHYFWHTCICVQVYFSVKMWTLKYKKLGINFVFPHTLNLHIFAP